VINFFYHNGVYQGNSAMIAKEAWCLPMTQKAVVKAIIASEILNDPD
jgi:hypothetical protein